MSERLLQILIDSFPKMLIPGLTMTILRHDHCGGGGDGTVR